MGIEGRLKWLHVCYVKITIPDSNFFFILFAYLLAYLFIYRKLQARFAI